MKSYEEYQLFYFLQDFYDEFFRGTSASARGSLSYLKNIFNFRQVKADISDNFSQAWELMALATEGLVVLMAMGILGVDCKDDDLPDDTDIEALSFEIIDRVWHPMDQNALLIEQEAAASGDMGVQEFCCGEDIEEDMIGCDSRGNCVSGEWFHFTCVDLDPDDVPDVWYCSKKCQYRFCFCHEDKGKKAAMIECSAGKKCLYDHWYHLSCLKMKEEEIPQGDWFCNTKCKKVPKTGKSAAAKGKSKGKGKGKKGKKEEKTKDGDDDDKDCVNLYTLAMVWFGLNLLTRRDAVREADGVDMMTFWKIDLVRFFANGHYKYTILAHRLIAGKCLTP